ncbi:hypothetical protein MRX96_052249, partial [Rhipicephalus microplus]
MDFQSAMETFAEAWVAANTQTPLTEAAEAQSLAGVPPSVGVAPSSDGRRNSNQHRRRGVRGSGVSPVRPELPPSSPPPSSLAAQCSPEEQDRSSSSCEAVAPTRPPLTCWLGKFYKTRESLFSGESAYELEFSVVPASSYEEERNRNQNKRTDTGRRSGPESTAESTSSGRFVIRDRELGPPATDGCRLTLNAGEACLVWDRRYVSAAAAGGAPLLHRPGLDCVHGVFERATSVLSFAGKTLPVHCVVERVPSPQTDSQQPSVEVDSYAIVPSAALFVDLVRTALTKLGYSPSEAICAK